MNKIFKVIYSKTRHCYVVVSELAKSHCKTTQSHAVRSKTALTAAVLLAVGTFSVASVFMPITAEAADKTRTDGSNFVGVERTNGLLDESKYENSGGKGANGADSITLGLRAKAGEGTITIGDRNAGASLGSVYVGQGDIAKPKIDIGGWATSIGYNSDATGYGSIALGSNAVAKNSYAKDSKGESLHYSDPYTENGEQKVRLVAKPDIQRASVAIGYGASADNGNIAIGSYSDASTDLRTAKTADGKEIKSYLTDKKADSYVSVGKSDALRRISNVADGAADSDVATIGQLKKLSARAGVYNEGWGIKIGDYTKKDANGQETTVKNAISIDRNLGSNEITSKSNNTFEAAGENSLILGGAGTDDFVAINGKHREKDYGSYGKDSVLVGGENNKTTKDGTYAVISGGGQNIASGKHSFIGGGWWNTATGTTSTVVGGQANTASGNQSTIVGGDSNRAIGDESSILGGNGHTAVGESSTISGGVGAYTLGSYSSVSGGKGNVAIGMTSSADGGWLNFAYGDTSQVSGGYSNYALGNYSNSLGGRNGVVQGNVSVGIAGGSTGAGAGYALAAGYQSVVTGDGVRREKSDDVYDAIMEAGKDAQGNEGYKYTDVATALGYQATANETNTVSFGHDKGDVSGYTVNWDIKYDTDDQGNIKFNEDGMPLVESIKANGITTNHYDSAKYNRLVKVADGINNHDVVVMEQLRNADNVGKNAKNNVVVYKENKDGTLQVDENGEAIIDVDASKAATEKATEQAIKDSEDAWGSALGTGKVEANNSQLVTGDTVYNAIQNQAEWKLTTNGESADKAAAIKPGTTVNFSAEENGKDHRNVTISHNGSNVTIGLNKDIVLGDTSYSRGGSLNVYTDSSDGNNLSNHVSINGSTISVNYPKSNGDKKTPTDTRGVILGVGEEDSKPDGYIAFNNVEGGYTYLHASTNPSDDKKGRLEYVGSDGNKKYIANLDDVSTAVNNAKTKYYAVNEKAPLMNLDTYKNEGNDGAKGMGSLAAGFVTHADGIASTVAGSYSGVIGSGLQGAAAVSVGTVNVNQNTDPKKMHSGVANSIVGQANMTTNSNAAIIYGAGNTVTDSYRPIKEEKAKAILSSSNPTELSKAMQDAVKESGGQVMVMGGGNNVESAYMSQVVGVGNTVKGNQVKNTKGEWGTDTSDTAIKDYNSEKSSQYNYVDGFNNEVINGKHDYIIGANNKLSGDSYDDDKAQPIKRSNKSNIVFGDNHTLTNTKNAVIIGSSDTQMILDKGDNATAIGHNASAQRDALAVGVNTEAGGNAVALGTSTIAHNNSIAIGTKATAVSSQNLAIGWEAHIGNIKTDNEKIKNAVALGSDSQVKVNDLLESDNNRGVLSIGDKDKERRIIHVRAGVNDTDAVNVSQLKSAQSDLTGKGLKFAANSGNEYTAKLGTTVKVLGTAKTEGHEYTADNLTTEIDEKGNITILMDKNVSAEKIAVNGKDGENGKPGTAGSIGISGQDGKAGVGIDGKDGISIKGQNGKDGVTIKGIDGVDGVDGAEGHIGLNGKDGMTDIFTTAGTPGLDGKDGETMTRIVYKDPKGTEHEAATLDDGLKFKGDDGKEIAKKLNNTLDIIGGADSKNLTEGNIGVNSTDKGQLKVQLAKDLTGITSISNQKTEGGKTTGAKITLGTDGNVDVNGGKITKVGSGIEEDATGNITEASKTNAANIGDVQTIAESTATSLTGKGLKFAANSGDEYTAKLGSTVTIQGTAKKEGHEYTADNLTTEIDEKGNITILMDKNVSAEKIAVNGKDGENGKPGTAGSIGISGQDGKAGVGIDGKDGISIKGQNGKDGVTIKGIDGVDGVDGAEGHIGLNGKDGMTDIFTTAGKPGLDGKDGETMTRIVYKDPKGTGHEVATLDDGLNFKGDDSTVIAKKLNNTLDIIGGADSKNLTEGNIGVNSTTDGKLKVQLAKDLTGITSISNQTTTKVGDEDVTTGAKITLGTDGTTTISGGDVNVSGNKITHVGSGIETDANGKYTVTDQNKGNAANIGDVQNMVNEAVNSAADTTNKALAGKANIDASNIGANLKNADGSVASAEDQKTNAEKWGSAIGTGEIKADDGRMVTGKTVYDEVRPKVDGSYVKKDKTTGENLSALDSKIGSLDQDGNYIKKDDSVSKNLSTLDTQVKNNAESIQNITNNVKNLSNNAVQYDEGSNKTKVTLGGEGGTTITNVKDGALNDSSTDAVNGKQLYAEQTARKELETKVTSNTTEINNIKDGQGFTDKGKEVIRDLAKGSVKVIAGTNTTVTPGTDEDGATTYAVNVEGKGKVASGDTGLISGGTLYKEVHVDTDGSYIKGSQTVGQNLSALDTGLKTTSDLIHTNTKGDTIQIGGNSTATRIDVNGKDGKGRVITGVVSDANDPNSAANVGYVNGLTAANTQQIYRDMNNAYSRLDTNINRAAAGSNALAALHPLEFDPADKASFAVGYGHYHNANAAAIGAFYQPNANTMVNMGISLGNGDPGFNAGVSFKLGQGSVYNGVSKAEMAQTIQKQSEQINALEKANQKMEKENEEMKAQIKQILERLNG